MQAIGDNKPEECIMIGDNFERDIQGALNAGLQVIWYNPNNKTEITNDLKVRMWECENCGNTNDRDINASINIMFEGIKIHFAS